MTNQHVTYLVFVGCGVIGLIAFVGLIVAPAVSSYKRVWERAAAVVLSLYVLAAFVVVGVALGALIIYEWPHWF
jgi:hypothetical protein